MCKATKELFVFTNVKKKEEEEEKGGVGRC